MVLEDDAEFLAPVSPLRFRNLIYLGKLPAHVGGNIMDTLPASLQEVYYPFKCVIGTFAYGINPSGARKLLNAAQKTAVYAVDNFMAPDKLHMLFYRQQPIITNTKFSSIR